VRGAGRGAWWWRGASSWALFGGTGRVQPLPVLDRLGKQLQLSYLSSMSERALRAEPTVIVECLSCHAQGGERHANPPYGIAIAMLASPLAYRQASGQGQTGTQGKPSGPAVGGGDSMRWTGAVDALEMARRARLPGPARRR
jgi:hypothetical protein